jgi:hypothetical protein
LSDPAFEDVETYCSIKRSKPVVLFLRAESASKGSVISGFAVSCYCEVGCLKGVQCLLGKRITTRRKQK